MLCQKFQEVLRKDGTVSANEDGLLCRKVHFDKAIQNLAPVRYKKALHYHRYCSRLTGNPETQRMNDVLSRAYYRPHTTSEVHEFVFKCESCRRYRP